MSQQDCDGFIHDLEKELKKSDGEMLASGHVVMELQFGDLIANESLREIFQDLSSRLGVFLEKKITRIKLLVWKLRILMLLSSIYIILVVCALIRFRLKHNGAREDENMDRQPKDLIAEPQELDNGRKTLLSSLKSSTAELPPASPSSEINDKTIPSTGMTQQRSTPTDFEEEISWL